jgi:glutathione S-transferase
LALQVVNQRLTGRQWFFDHFTAVDAYLFWCLRRAGQLGFDPGEFAHCQKLFDRVAGRPSTQAVLAHEATALAKAGY